MRTIIMSVLILITPVVYSDTTGDSDSFFSWAETTYPSFFSPNNQTSSTSGDWYYRYYSATDNYLAINTTDNYIYAFGDVFNGLLSVETLYSLLISSGINTLPVHYSSINFVDIPAGTYSMGDNNLKGPQSGQATEHSVTLSTFKMSDTEISNSQYLEFLNSALTNGLIEVKTGTSGPDAGQNLIIGTSASSYANKVLYSLSGTRVMKDHDNADNDNDPFSGTIEPENPINIAYIAYNSISNVFYLKDPHDASDFNWMTLSDYYNYSSTTRQNDTSVLLNDFDQWPELTGWTESNPQLAANLPNKETVSNYPVTFIRWWGAKAFADFYQLKLPSEAQWEYAAKGGNNFKYSVFDGISTNDANWNSANLNPATHHVLDVKSGSANPYGLYNLGGNVWEWMADNYAPYTDSAVDNPLIAETESTSRSWRGGSWNYHEATLETSGRYFDDENRGNDHFGFRVVNKH